MKQGGNFYGQDLDFLPARYCKSGGMWQCSQEFWGIHKLITIQVMAFYPEIQGHAPCLHNCKHDHSMATVRVWLNFFNCLPSSID